MAETIVLGCESRELVSKSYLQQLREKGRVPAIVYGKGLDNLHVSMDARQLSRVFYAHGARGIFSLQLENGKQLMALIREIQRNPISGDIVHIDFMHVRAEEKITSMVPVFISGEEDVLKKGGVIQTETIEVEVECLPPDLPDSIPVNISHLDVGEKITVGDLQVPPAVKIISDPEALVISILHPAKEEEEEAPLPEEEAEAEAEA